QPASHDRDPERHVVREPVAGPLRTEGAPDADHEREQIGADEAAVVGADDERAPGWEVLEALVRGREPGLDERAEDLEVTSDEVGVAARERICGQRARELPRLTNELAQQVAHQNPEHATRPRAGSRGLANAAAAASKAVLAS